MLHIFQSMEAEKLAPIAKAKERAQEALTKSQLETEAFARATQDKLRRSMEVNQENRNAQIQALQTRLREHVSTPVPSQYCHSASFLPTFIIGSVP